MRRRGSVNLPQKTLKTKVTFDQKVPCLLHIAMAGKKFEDMPAEEKERFMQTFCTHRVWPAFMPSCQECLKDTKYDITLVDKKNREYRKVG